LNGSDAANEPNIRRRNELGFQNIVRLGYVSLSTDVSTEMVLGVLPIFIVKEMGGDPAAEPTEGGKTTEPDKKPSNPGKLVRLKTWEEFKTLAIASRLNEIVYRIEQGMRRGHLTSLRLILPIEGAQFVFFDVAQDGALKQTGIPIHVDERGIRYIREQDVIVFLRKELGSPDLKVSSFWTV